jgi:hypothetical protein
MVDILCPQCAWADAWIRGDGSDFRVSCPSCGYSGVRARDNKRSNTSHHSGMPEAFIVSVTQSIVASLITRTYAGAIDQVDPREIVPVSGVELDVLTRE